MFGVLMIPTPTSYSLYIDQICCKDVKELNIHVKDANGWIKDFNDYSVKFVLKGIHINFNCGVSTSKKLLTIIWAYSFILVASVHHVLT